MSNFTHEKIVTHYNKNLNAPALRKEYRRLEGQFAVFCLCMSGLLWLMKKKEESGTPIPPYTAIMLFILIVLAVYGHAQFRKKFGNSIEPLYDSNSPQVFYLQLNGVKECLHRNGVSDVAQIPGIVNNLDSEKKHNLAALFSVLEKYFLYPAVGLVGCFILAPYSHNVPMLWDKFGDLSILWIVTVAIIFNIRCHFQPESSEQRVKKLLNEIIARKCLK